MQKWIKRLSFLVIAVSGLFSKAYTQTGNHVNFYIDMGELYGAYMEGNWNTYFGTNTSNETYIIQSAVDDMLSTLYNNLLDAGTNQINLSFAQVQYIDELYSGEGDSHPSDTIGQILYDGYLVGTNSTTTGLNLIQYMIQEAANSGITVDLSFGGEAVTTNDFKIVPLLGANETASGQAVKLALFLKDYGFKAVDFDIEATTLNELFVINSTAEVLNFFKTLHIELKKYNIDMNATFLGSLSSQGPETTLAPLCQNVLQFFDGVNLMLYGGAGGQYYIDWDNSDFQGVDWGINQWLSYIKNPQSAHIGFYNSIAYEDTDTVTPSPSAGYVYTIPASSTRGASAAIVYIYMLAHLTPTHNSAQFGQPFWWTDLPQNMITIGPDAAAVDFYEYLQSQ